MGRYKIVITKRARTTGLPLNKSVEFALQSLRQKTDLESIA
jgi:hypothetical protein